MRRKPLTLGNGDTGQGLLSNKLITTVLKRAYSLQGRQANPREFHVKIVRLGLSLKSRSGATKLGEQSLTLLMHCSHTHDSVSATVVATIAINRSVEFDCIIYRIPRLIYSVSMMGRTDLTRQQNAPVEQLYIHVVHHHPWHPCSWKVSRSL